MTFDRFGIVGGGAWGTALAQTLAVSGKATLLWARELETVESINARHVNDLFLPGVALNPSLKATQSITDMGQCDVVLMVTPAQHVRSVAHELKAHLHAKTPIVLCAKGIEQATGKQMKDVLAEVLASSPVAVLSGPSFALDVARGLPAAVTLASTDKSLGQALADSIGNRHLRIYWTDDVTGVEIGGALKNVLAIAAGIVDGKALGASAHAGLVTRGFAELRRFGEAHGARLETLMGLSGLGDLILTCGSPKSRNMSLGHALGEGQVLADVLGARRAVTEGVHTASAVQRIAEAKGIDMPITRAVTEILDGRVSVDAAIAGLMQRPQKAED